jgi:ribose transport system ATP-binding protein
VPQPVVAARYISKRFGSTVALDRASVAVAPGEVHGLVGQNGSGKSTLIGVLAGYHVPQSGGRLEVGGSVVPMPLRPGQAMELGMSFVHQDLGLIPSLSVVENLLLGELARSRRPFISWPREVRRAEGAFARLRIAIDPEARVGDLELIERAQVAIVRAVSELSGLGQRTAGGLLALDEPASYLPGGERAQLFALVSDLAGRGCGVLLVTHDLEDALAHTDRITVLRDGRDVATVKTAETDAVRLAELMGGTTVAHVERSAGAAAGQATVTVVDLSGTAVQHASFVVGDREIVGITGMPGSGFEEVPYLLYGAARCRSGELSVDGRHHVLPITPARALSAGVALLPGDRLRDGGVASLSLASNVMLPVLRRYTSRLRLQRDRMSRDAGLLLRRHGVRPADPDSMLGALSGGNQQKALLAKWIGTNPRLLLLDEPTRGVDVLASREIITAIRELAGEGIAVLYAGADHDLLAATCDRVLVFAAGSVADELAGDQLTATELTNRCRTASAVLTR